jgi:hypothetical protein
VHETMVAAATGNPAKVAVAAAYAG